MSSSVAGGASDVSCSNFPTNSTVVNLYFPSASLLKVYIYIYIHKFSGVWIFLLHQVIYFLIVSSLNLFALHQSDVLTVLLINCYVFFILCLAMLSSYLILFSYCLVWLGRSPLSPVQHLLNLLCWGWASLGCVFVEELLSVHSE